MTPRPYQPQAPAWQLGSEHDESTASQDHDELQHADDYPTGLDTNDAKLVSWELPGPDEEEGIIPFAGDLNLNHGTFAPSNNSVSDGHPNWGNDAQSQREWNLLQGFHDSLPIDSENHREPRTNLSEAALSQASQPRSKQSTPVLRLSPSSPQATERSLTPQRGRVSTQEARLQPAPKPRASSTGQIEQTSQAQRTATRRVQFSGMPPAGAQWPRSEGGGSSVSPKNDMTTSDMADEDRRRADSNGPKTSILRSRQVEAFNDIKAGLPAEKGFPIQIGSELFRLSGASIMSDAPSYFSKFFEEQLRANDEPSGSVKTLYIDRDPLTFQDIALHLQGYRVLPRDGYHYVKLFADAQFYGLPKLIKQLFESEYFIRIGEKEFRIPKDIFSAPGDTPNFFTLGFAIFAPSPGEVFPGLSNEGLFRPPSIDAPALLNRSASTFSDILHLLRGYPLRIRSPEHRTELLRDCRYYHLRGLEQQLIQHSITYNVARQRSEIVLRLEDVRQSGISFLGDILPSDRSPLAGWVNYSRPFTDEAASELILELGDESTQIWLRTMRAEFFGQAKARISSLFQVVSNKLNLQGSNVPLGLMIAGGGTSGKPVSPGHTPLSDELVKVAIERDAHVLLDGEEYDTAHLPRAGGDDGEDASSGSGATEGGGGLHLHPASRSPSLAPPRKRARRGSLDDFGEWLVKRGQWRLRVQPRTDGAGNVLAMEVVLIAVKLDAVSGQRGRNALRGFLNEA